MPSSVCSPARRASALSATGAARATGLLSCAPPREASMEHDVIAVGGGMAGSALAKALAEAGLRVLVLERETAFRDRVRGEQMLCWGVAEAQALGVHDLLRQTCGHE